MAEKFDFECHRYLGSGVFSRAMMNTRGTVNLFKEHSDVRNEMEDLYYDQVERAPPNVQKHLVKRLGQVDGVMLVGQSIKCPDREQPITFSSNKIDVQEIEYGGDMVVFSEMSDEDIFEMIFQLLPVLGYMQDVGMFHQDVHLRGNILNKFDSVSKKNVYILIDYFNTQKPPTGRDMMYLLQLCATGLMQQLEKRNSRKTIWYSLTSTQKNDSQLNEQILNRAKTFGYKGDCVGAATIYMAYLEPNFVADTLELEDVDEMRIKWLCNPIALVHMFDMISRVERAANEKVWYPNLWSDLAGGLVQSLQREIQLWQMK